MPTYGFKRGTVAGTTTPNIEATGPSGGYSAHDSGKNIVSALTKVASYLHQDDDLILLGELNDAYQSEDWPLFKAKMEQAETTLPKAVVDALDIFDGVPA